GSELRTYARDATTGLLAPIFAIDDSVVPELARLTALVPSADGAHLYALAGVSGEPLQILVWLRNATTGELSVVSEIPPGAGGLESYGDVAISPDGEHLYVSSFSPRRGFARFRRDPAT